MTFFSQLRLQHKFYLVVAVILFSLYAWNYIAINNAVSTNKYISGICQKYIIEQQNNSTTILSLFKKFQNDEISVESVDKKECRNKYCVEDYYYTNGVDSKNEKYTCSMYINKTHKSDYGFLRYIYDFIFGLLLNCIFILGILIGITPHIPQYDVIAVDHRKNRYNIDEIYENPHLLKYVVLQDDWLCRNVVSKDGMSLQYVIDQTHDICLAAVRQNGLALEYVKPELKTEYICECAIRQNPHAITFAKDPSHEMYVDALSCDGLLLREVNNKEKTPMMCLVAIKNNPKAIYHVPYNLVTLEMCLEVVRKDGMLIGYIQNKKLLSHNSKKYYVESSYEAVKQNGLAIRYIDPYILASNPNIYIEAVKQNGMALEFIDQQTEDICMEAIKQNPHSFQFVKAQTERLCMEVIKLDGCMISEIINITDEICMIAVKQNGLALEYVDIQSYDIVMAAIQQNYEALEYVHEYIITPSIYLAAIQQNVDAHEYIKYDQIKDIDDFNLQAVKINGIYLQYVENQTYDIVLAAVKQNGNSLQYVDDKFITNKICVKAVKQNWMAWVYVPISEQTLEICAEVYKNDRYTLLNYDETEIESYLNNRNVDKMIKRVNKSEYKHFSEYCYEVDNVEI